MRHWREGPPPIYDNHIDLSKYRALSDNDKRAFWNLPPQEDLTWPLDAPQDNVNSPAHYNTGGIECFDAMKAMLTDEEMIGYLRGNSFKYRWRFRHKGGAEDLKKAEWYERKLLEIVANST